MPMRDVSRVAQRAAACRCSRASAVAVVDSAACVPSGSGSVSADAAAGVVASGEAAVGVADSGEAAGGSAGAGTAACSPLDAAGAAAGAAAGSSACSPISVSSSGGGGTWSYGHSSGPKGHSVFSDPSAHGMVRQSSSSSFTPGVKEWRCPHARGAGANPLRVVTLLHAPLFHLEHARSRRLR